MWPWTSHSPSLRLHFFISKVEKKVIKHLPQALGVGDGQGSLESCSLWGRKVRHDWATKLNWTTKQSFNIYFMLLNYYLGNLLSPLPPASGLGASGSPGLGMWTPVPGEGSKHPLNSLKPRWTAFFVVVVIVVCFYFFKLFFFPLHSQSFFLLLIFFSSCVILFYFLDVPHGM